MSSTTGGPDDQSTDPPGSTSYSSTPTEPPKRGALAGVLFTIGVIVVGSGLIIALIFGVMSALSRMDSGRSNSSESSPQDSGFGNGGDEKLTAKEFYKGPVPERFTYQIDDGPKVAVERTGRWDRPTCKGIGRSSASMSLLADGGCRYAVEQVVKSQRDRFWMGQFVMELPDAAKARKVGRAIEAGGGLENYAFRIPDPGDRDRAFLRVDALDKYVVVSAVALEAKDKQASMSSADRQRFGKEVATAFTYMHAESVNVLRFR